MLADVKNPTLMLIALTLAMAITMRAAQADDDEDQGKAPMVSNAKWVSECGACHLAYPPRMLPAESWRAIMAGLDKHFGSNAGLDAADVNEITAFLEKNADTRKKSHEMHRASRYCASPRPAGSSPNTGKWRNTPGKIPRSGAAPIAAHAIPRLKAAILTSTM